jgi:hypothetical protein
MQQACLDSPLAPHYAPWRFTVLVFQYAASPWNDVGSCDWSGQVIQPWQITKSISSNQIVHTVYATAAAKERPYEVDVGHFRLDVGLDESYQTAQEPKFLNGADIHATPN